MLNRFHRLYYKNVYVRYAVIYLSMQLFGLPTLLLSFYLNASPLLFLVILYPLMQFSVLLKTKSRRGEHFEGSLFGAIFVIFLFLLFCTPLYMSGVTKFASLLEVIFLPFCTTYGFFNWDLNKVRLLSKRKSDEKNKTSK